MLAIDLVETGVPTTARMAISQKLGLSGLERIDVNIMSVLGATGLVQQHDNRVLCAVSGYIDIAHGLQSEAGWVLAVHQMNRLQLGVSFLRIAKPFEFAVPK